MKCAGKNTKIFWTSKATQGWSIDFMIAINVSFLIALSRGIRKCAKTGQC